MKRDKKRTEDFDDGRVIADMSIDGVPQSIFRRFAFYKSERKNGEKEAINLSRKEQRGIILGIVSSYLLFGIVFFGLLVLFILFCTKVWFR